MPAGTVYARRPSAGLTLASSNAQVATTAAAAAVQPARPVKVVYRNSVLPGGVGSAAELTAALARDPVAAAHYAGFDAAAARPVQVVHSRMAHVSYRIGDKIFWTKKPVRLALGETLLSDGEHLVRARCGNRIADQPQSPVLLNEPAAEVLETAFLSAEPLIDAPSEAAPRANGAAAAHAADAQPATETRSATSFAFSPAAIDSPMYSAALRAPPVSGTSVTVSEPPTAAPTETRAQKPGFEKPPFEKSPPGQSPPEPSPPKKSPPGKPPTPDSPPPSMPPARLNVPPAPTPIPEPGSVTLFGLAFAIIMLMRRAGILADEPASPR